MTKSSKQHLTHSVADNFAYDRKQFKHCTAAFFKPIKPEDVIGNSPFLTAVHSSVNLLEELGVLSSHYPLADKSVDSCYLFNG